jgi:membrane protease YdiL (CAAX protease family)
MRSESGGDVATEGRERFGNCGGGRGPRLWKFAAPPAGWTQAGMLALRFLRTRLRFGRSQRRDAFAGGRDAHRTREWTFARGRILALRGRNGIAESARPVHAFAKIVLYLFGTVVLGALLAPLLFHLGQALGASLRWQMLIESDFQRYLNRSMLVAAVALLWPAMRALNIRDWRVAGLKPNPRRWQDLAFGFFISVAVMAALGWFLIGIGMYRLKTEPPFEQLGKIALSAAAVALIEEGLFRGGILGLVRRTATPLTALLLVSALYSIVHFLKAGEAPFAADQVQWYSGFVLLPQALRQFQDPMLLLGGFSTLFLLGWILGYAAIKTESLWLPIGIHAGCIFGKFGFGKLTKRQEEMLPWFGRDMQVGIGPLIVLAVLGLIVWFWIRQTHDRAGATDG